MKRFVAIVLMSAFIAGTLHLDELARFPNLLRHYQEHKAMHRADTVFEFLFNHYILNDQTTSTSDQSNHSQLPFKSEKKFQSHFAFFVFDNSPASLTSHQIVQLFFPNTGIKSIPGFSSIWQPPKIG